MRRTVFRTGVLMLLSTVAVVPMGLAQVNYLKPAMVRIKDLHNQNGGSGFIFRYDGKEQSVYILTNEHVVRGAQQVNVQFFSGNGSSAEGTVIRQDRAKDLAVVKVTGNNNIPSDVLIIKFGQATALMPGDPVDLLSYSAADEEWSVTTGTVEGLRDEVVGNNPSEKVHAIRFTGFVRDGDSGSPLIMRLRVFGLVESAPMPGASDSPRAIQVATIQEFLRELLPAQDSDPIWVPQPKPVPGAAPKVDREALACATSFLDLMIQNKIAEAYGHIAELWKASTSQAAFVATFDAFAMAAKGGPIHRELADAQAHAFPPGVPQIVAPTYVFTFKSSYSSNLSVTVFETVTVIEQQETWRVLSFIWNPQPSDSSGR
jgi:hypothetical protein